VKGDECPTSGDKCCAGIGCFQCCSDADCDDGKVCTGNQCVILSCSAPQIACNSKCVNPTTDSLNCGLCGNACGPGRTCAASKCTPQWVATAAPPAGFVAREKAASAALGSKVFVWGGSDAAGKALANGAVYDPATDAWATVPATGVPPSARVLATAVWTGTVMVVWGGGDAAATVDYNSGSRYDPVTGSWSAMTTQGAPAGRRGAYGFWTGSRVLVYGGVNRAGASVATVELYDPVNDSWSSAATKGAPTGRTDPTVGWSGSLLFVYGGSANPGGATDNTHVLDVAANVWKKVSNGPSARYGAFGTWDGSLLLAWGGVMNGIKADGETFDPSADKWSSVQAFGAPIARYLANRQTGWTARIKPRVSLILGGYGPVGYLTNGAIYNSTTNAWSSVSSWPSGASHIGGAGVWTGTQLVLWGGRSGATSALTTAGERYLP
jgi:N-acetylneuraminic acid mutarotase